MNAVRKQSEAARLAIESVAHKELSDEIEYRLELQRENPDNDDDFDNYMLALMDSEEFAENTESRVLLNKCRRALIALGHYRIITPGELARIQTFGGRKKYDFQLSGKRYVWTKTPTHINN